MTCTPALAPAVVALASVLPGQGMNFILRVELPFTNYHYVWEYVTGNNRCTVYCTLLPRRKYLKNCVTVSSVRERKYYVSSGGGQDKWSYNLNENTRRTNYARAFFCLRGTCVWQSATIHFRKKLANSYSYN